MDFVAGHDQLKRTLRFRQRFPVASIRQYNALVRKIGVDLRQRQDDLITVGACNASNAPRGWSSESKVDRQPSVPSGLFGLRNILQVQLVCVHSSYRRKKFDSLIG
jgi:hypothetical protein